MARLRWSPQATADLERICEYIASDSEHYARLFADGVVAQLEELEAHPRIERVVPEYQEEALRERLYQNYRLVYELTGKWIEVVAVVHSARDFKGVRLK